jgi:hypothetical protein
VRTSRCRWKDLKVISIKERGRKKSGGMFYKHPENKAW